jgi:hypothetical protein
MAPKTKKGRPSRAAAPPSEELVSAGPWLTPPWTTEERLLRIEAMGQRINGYIRFMCQAGRLNGASAEAKEKAVIAFYERLTVVESELGRIQEDLQLA